MSARNSFPENHPLFAGFLAADRAQNRRRASRAPTSSWCSARRRSRTTSRDPARTFPQGVELVQLIDDPAMAAWAPVGVSDRHRSRSSAFARCSMRPRPGARRARSRARRRRRASTALADGRYLLQQIAALRPAGQHHRRGSAEQPRPDARLSADRRSETRSTRARAAASAMGCRLRSASRSARPGAKVIAVLGDGSSMYAIQGCGRPRDCGLAMTFIIINNGCYEALNEFGRHFDISSDCRASSCRELDFCGLARRPGAWCVARRRTAPSSIAALTRPSRHRRRPSSKSSSKERPRRTRTR